MASVPARSCTFRDSPVRAAACWGSELPAMKPATHAIACSASTRPLRNRMWEKSPTATEVLTPGSASGVASGCDACATTKTAASSVTAVARLHPTHARSTGHGSAFQRRSAALVASIPWTSTSSFVFMPMSVIGSGGRPAEPLLLLEQPDVVRETLRCDLLRRVPDPLEAALVEEPEPREVLLARQLRGRVVALPQRPQLRLAPEHPAQPVANALFRVEAIDALRGVARRVHRD